MFKLCKKCGKTKLLEEMTRNKFCKDGASGTCKECSNKQKKEWKYRAGWTDRSYNLYYSHKITEEEVNKMIEEQNGVCSLCHGEFTKINYAVVDHDHSCCVGRRSCGKCIRGIIHTLCNQGLGCFKDNLEMLENAKVYLVKKHV